MHVDASFSHRLCWPVNLIQQSVRREPILDSRKMLCRTPPRWHNRPFVVLLVGHDALDHIILHCDAFTATGAITWIIRSLNIYVLEIARYDAVRTL